MSSGIHFKKVEIPAPNVENPTVKPTRKSFERVIPQPPSVILLTYQIVANEAHFMNRNRILAGSVFALMAAAFTGHWEGDGANKKGEYVVYLDPVGIPTWCGGETKNTLGKKIIVGKTKFTKTECRKLLESSLRSHNAPLEKLNYDLTDGEHYAFLDGIYNFGETKFNRYKIGQLVATGKPQLACDQFLTIRYAAKRDCSIRSNGCYGIWERRQAQRMVCNGTITVEEFLAKIGKLPRGGEE